MLRTSNIVKSENIAFPTYLLILLIALLTVTVGKMTVVDTAVFTTVILITLFLHSRF